MWKVNFQEYTYLIETFPHLKDWVWIPDSQSFSSDKLEAFLVSQSSVPWGKILTGFVSCWWCNKLPQIEGLKTALKSFIRSSVGRSLEGLAGSSAWCSQGQDQDAGRAELSSVSREEFTSQLLQSSGRGWFSGLVGLRSRFPCMLLAGVLLSSKKLAPALGSSFCIFKASNGTWSPSHSSNLSDLFSSPILPASYTVSFWLCFSGPCD